MTESPAAPHTHAGLDASLRPFLTYLSSTATPNEGWGDQPFWGAFFLLKGLFLGRLFFLPAFLSSLVYFEREIG